MSDGILNIDQMKNESTEVIEIPGFKTGETVKVRVRKPRLLTMAQQGEIPNHLINIAGELLVGRGAKETNSSEESIRRMNNTTELYGRACLVEPTYDEFIPYMTDQQANHIFLYAIGELTSLDSFREDREDDTDNTDGKQVQPKA